LIKPLILADVVCATHPKKPVAITIYHALVSSYHHLTHSR
jgi:hypothetical protein